MTAHSLLAPFRRIRVKAALFVLLLLVSVTAGLYLITQQIMNRHILDEVVKRAESLGRSIASTAGYSIASQDLLGLDNLVYQIKTSNPDIDYVAVADHNGEILVHTETSRLGEVLEPAAGRVVRRADDGTVIVDVARTPGGRFEVRSPVRFMGRLLGAVVLGINKSSPAAAQREARRRILVIFGSILVLGVVASLVFSSLLTRPIRELSSGVAELKAGRRSTPLRVYSRDELGHLTLSFNEMMALIAAQNESLGRYARDLEDSYVSTVRVLAAAIDARDACTLGHSTRVAKLSLELGRNLGLGRDELEDLEIACLFHDVGKIRLPDSILLKQGRLTESEQREMRRHTEYGAEILAKATTLLKYIPGVRHHHEWHDGSGYPDGLAGEQIPLPAAIISLADVYDAMTSDRPYRAALTAGAARREIAGLAGRQFEPDLARRFIGILEANPAGAPEE
jgi:putative nucleotidyltransferase with HDIG domain